MAREEADASASESHQEHHHNNRDRGGGGGEQYQQYPLTRQSSLLTLTLDEIQNTVCEPGKNFGSMNMDEFLTNIWTVEEGNAMGGAAVGTGNSAAGQPSLHRQGSLTLPAPLCRKTVDEVWSEIHRDQQQQHQNHHHRQQQQYQSAGNGPRQPTFGEMTLEDFLIKAGVVREGGGCIPSSVSPLPLNQQPLHHQMPGYQPMVNERPGWYQEGGGVVTSSINGYGGGGGGGGFGYGVKIGNGYGAHQQHQQQQMGGGVGSPPSSGSSDGGLVDNNPDGRWGLDLGGAGGGSAAIGGADGGGGGGRGGRKRILDAPVEKVVERRQRRMIKNRESAARSRARKQAYTVELEGELNQLKEENARLQEEQRRLAPRRKQMLLEFMAEQSLTNARRKSKTLRRNTSCVW